MSAGLSISPTPRHERAEVFGTEADLLAVVEAFEAADLPRDRWGHVTRLAIAAWYLTHLPEPEATDRFIHNLLRYNRILGIEMGQPGGYNETVTLFWLTLANRVARAQADAPPLHVANEVVTRYGHRPELVLEYYSPHRIRSWRARQSWVDPDRRPLDDGDP